mgnify:FL=1
MNSVNSFKENLALKLGRPRKIYRYYLDRSVPKVKERWLVEFCLLVVFLLRVILGKGWYVVCYVLAIFMLNMLLGFLSPRFDPSAQDDLRSDEQEAGLGSEDMKKNEDFRPFLRRLPEFHFWYLSFNATLLSIFCTVFRTLDIPVFWPILVIYFVVLFVLTMRRQIQHMIKFRYIPFDIGKKRFAAQ